MDDVVAEQRAYGDKGGFYGCAGVFCDAIEDRGEVTFDGAEPLLGNAAMLQAYRRNAAMMFQDPVASLSPRLSVQTLITEPFLIHGMGERDRPAEARRLLGLVGLPPDFASRTTWADRYRNAHRETAAWHFVDIEIDHPDLAPVSPTP